GVVQSSRSRPHRHLCCRGVFWRRLGVTLAHPVHTRQQTVSRTSRAGTKLCLDHRRMYRLADLRRDSRAEHSFLACLKRDLSSEPAKKTPLRLGWPNILPLTCAAFTRQ